MAADRVSGIVRGFVVLGADAGRALRSDRRLPSRDDVLDCSGDFHPGDLVYVTMRGRDGGQSVIAIALSAIEAASLRVPASMRPGERDARVLLAEGLNVLWTRPR